MLGIFDKLPTNCWSTVLLILVAFAAVASAQFTPHESSTPAGRQVINRVHGNLVLLNDNGAWSWYQDERAIVNQQAETLLVSSVAASLPGVNGPRDGHVDVTTFDFSNGRRTRFVLAEIEEDDHNVAALLKRPDGRYLAVYANHNTDRITRYRVSENLEDASSWGPERTFDWRQTPGNDFNVTYSNLFYLSEEKHVYNFARVNDRSPNLMISSDDGDSWSYGGQLTKSEDVGYVNGYFKYASNGVDRIHFIATEVHPRDYNNGIYHAYIEKGRLFRSGGELIDGNIHDNQNIPATNSLSPVFIPDQEDGTQQRHRAWTTDLALDKRGRPYALFTARAGDAVTSADGAGDDRRLFYARFDGKDWTCHEVAKMGRRLFASEQDYTGLGALVPGDPHTIVISTTINPVSGEETPFHEIYLGRTEEDGQNWQWAPITSNSTVDNLRPIVPEWRGGQVAVLWFRGVMVRSQAYDASIVGVFLRQEETIGPVHYVDASFDSTRAGGTHESAEGELRGLLEQEGVGNGNAVFATKSDGDQDAPLLKTTISGLDDGIYDVFVYFWGDPQGHARLTAGLKPEALLAFSQRNSQAAEIGQFASGQDVLVTSNSRQLYRAYVGREQVKRGSTIPVFIGGFDSHDLPCALYDGIGYARVRHDRRARGAASGRTTSRPKSAAATPAQRTDRNSQIAHLQLLEKAKSGRVDVYFIGDSITRRWGATDYPELLANWRENFHGWNAGNFGWGGDETQHILWRLQHGELDGVDPKVIVVLAGTNNIGSHPNGDAIATDVTEGLQEIVRTCQAKAPMATVIVTGILPRNDNSQDPLVAMSAINKVNSNIEKLADGNKVRYLNVNDQLANPDGKLHEGMTVDKLHLSAKGCQVWADALRPVLTELLGPPSEEDLAPPPTGDPSAAR